MEDGRINIKVGLSTEELQKGIESALQQINNINNGVAGSSKQMQEALQDVGDAGETAFERIDDAMLYLTEGGNNVAELMSKTGNSIESVTETIEQLGNNIKTQEGVVNSLQESYNGLEASIKTAQEQGEVEKVQQLTDEYKNLGAELSAESEVLSRMSQVMVAAQGQMERLSQAAKGGSAGLKDMQGMTAGLDETIGVMPSGIQSVAKGFKTFLKLGKALLTNPIGLVLTAIAVAIAAIHAAFTGTVEGQKKFAQVSGYLNGILAKLKDVLIAVGKYLISAFTNPKQAIKDLVNLIKENIYNRFVALGEIAQALGKGLKAAFKLDVEGAKSAFAELTSAGVKFATGIDNLSEKVGNFAKKLNDVGKENASLELRKKNLEIEISEWAKKKEELEIVKAKARRKLYDTSLSDAERKKAVEDYKKAVEEQTETELKFQREKIAIRKRQNELSSSTIEDENALRELQAGEVALLAKKEQELASLQRFSNKVADGGVTKLTEYKNSVVDTMQKAEQEINDRSNSLMQDGLNKRLTILKSNYNKLIEENAKRQRDWLAEYEKANQLQAGKATVSNLTEEQRQTLKHYGEIAYKEYQKGIEQEKAKYLLESLQYATKDNYEQLKQELAEYYSKQIAVAKAEGDINKERALGIEYNTKLYELDKKINADYTLMFANAQILSKEQLNKAIKLLNTEISKAEPGTQKYIELLGQLRQQLNTKIDREDWGFSKILNGIKNVTKAKEALNNALEKGDKEGVITAESTYTASINSIKKGAEQVRDVFTKIGSTLEEIGGELGDIGSAIVGIANEVPKIAEAFTNTDPVSLIANGFKSALDLVSLITKQIADNAKAQQYWNKRIKESEHNLKMLKLQALDNKKANIFGIENPYQGAIAGAIKYGEAIKILNAEATKLENGQVQIGTKKVVSGKNVGIGIGSGTASGAGIGAGIGTAILPGLGSLIGGAIGGVIGLIVGGVSGALAKKTVPVFENLKKKYGEVFNKDTYELNAELLADAKAGKLNEETKKLVDNWEEVKNAAKSAEEQMLNTFQALAGNIGKDLSDSIVTAFKGGDINNAVDDFNKKIGQTIENIVTQQTIASVLKPQLDQMQKGFEASFKLGGDSSIVDDIMLFSKQVPTLVQAISEGLEAGKKQLNELGFDTDESNAREGLKKGIATASQDSIDELNGRFTAVQVNTLNTAKYTELLLNVTQSIWSNVKNIDRHTERMAGSIEELKGEVQKSGKAINEIATKGVKMQ